VFDLSGPRILAGTAKTRFTHVEVHASTDSTQTLLVSEGGRDGRVVIADHQTAGRGRQGRSWLDVPGAMLMFSVLLRGIPPDEAARTSLVAGVAVARAISDDARLKWPNDVRIGGRKVCGILGELAPTSDYVVVGIGVNVGHAPGDLPDDLDATSLAIERGTAPRRDDVCVAILCELDRLLKSADWMTEYRRLCETIGTRVRVELSDGSFEGVATDVRDDGALVVDDSSAGAPDRRIRVVMAGDVIHLR
jgi:BirA family transcriptional regulator, biotin operon repressor / biotin---[acetyl-CoA-carboxylase] ligase